MNHGLNRLRRATALAVCAGLTLTASVAVAAGQQRAAEAERAAYATDARLAAQLKFAIESFEAIAEESSELRASYGCHTCKGVRGVATYAASTLSELYAVVADPAMKRGLVFGKRNGLVNATRVAKRMMEAVDADHSHLQAQWTDATAAAHVALYALAARASD